MHCQVSSLQCSTLISVVLFLSSASAFSESSLRRLYNNSCARIESRNAFLKASLPHERQGFSQLTLHSPAAVALLAPSTACPFTLERSNLVSQDYEGGKWLCGVRDIIEARPCIVYSFGSNQNDLFEAHLRRTKSHCEIHVFDPTSPPLEAYNYHSLGLCAKGSSFTVGTRRHPCKSLEAIMLELGHAHIDVLKIDVEGAEWQVLQLSNWNALQVGQLLVELHDQAGAWSLPKLFEKILGPLEIAGYHLHSVEPVCAGCTGQFEVAFLNMHWRPFSKEPFRKRPNEPCAAKISHHRASGWRSLTGR